MENVNNTVNIIERCLQMVEKYKITTILKSFAIVILIALIAFFIANPTYFADKYEEYINNRHNKLVELRLQNNEQIHIKIEKLMYQVNADQVLLLECHNGGKSLSGLPFAKASCSYEALNNGVYPISQEFQQQQLSLIPFATYLFNNQYFAGDTDSLLTIDRGLFYKFKCVEIEHFSASVINGVDTPLAFLVVVYKDKQVHNCEEIKEVIKKASLELSLLLELNKKYINI